MADSKYTFSYESQINRRKNLFELALDFPIIGESKVSLSLNPKIASKEIAHSEIVDVLKEQLGDRADRDQIISTLKEFFVFASDFIRFKVLGTFPSQFVTSFENDHFKLTRETPHYRFEVDNFSENPRFFERTVFKIYLKSMPNSNSAMTLFLVPQSCDK